MLSTIFQSTLPREERLFPVRLAPMIKTFQSTLPREERLDITIKWFGIEVDFNPRSHERSDANIRNRFFGYINFNPRSHERSDGDNECSYCNLLWNFNPRSHERSDSNIAQKICLFLYNTDNKYIIR